MMKTTLMAITAIMATILSGALLSQATPNPRSHQAAIVETVLNNQHGLLTVRPDVGQNATARWIFDGLPTTVTATMPMEYVGDAVALSATQYLVSGCSSTTPVTGYLCRLELDPIGGAIIVRETATYPGFDPLSVAWEQGQPFLAFIDRASSSLMYAPFSGPPTVVTDPVLPPSAYLAVALTDAQCPALGAPFPTLEADSGSLYLTANSLARASEITLTQNGWTVTDPVLMQDNVWKVDASGGHAQPLKVMSLAPAFGTDKVFNVVHVSTASVVASGSIAALKTWMSIQSPTIFYDRPGDAFKVTGTLSSESAIFHPLVRYGSPAGDASVVPGAAAIFSESVYVGSPRAYYWVPTRMPGIPDGEGAAPAVQTTAYLLLGLGFRGTGAPPDPVVGSGVNARLQFSTAIGMTLKQAQRSTMCGYGMAVPADPLLEGLVVLTQWAIVSPTASNVLLFSDIAGSRIEPAPEGGALSSSSAPSIQSSQTTSLQVRRQHFEAWTQSDTHAVSPTSSAFQLLRERTQGH